MNDTGQVDQEYLNRYIQKASDFLFTLARYVAMKEGKRQFIHKEQNNRNLQNAHVLTIIMSTRGR